MSVKVRYRDGLWSNSRSGEDWVMRVSMKNVAPMLFVTLALYLSIKQVSQIASVTLALLTDIDDVYFN